MKIVYALASILALLLLFGWVGLKIKPAPFPAFGMAPPALETRPLPEGLPAPVERFYRLTYGDQIPVITSAVLDGRGTMAPFGIDLPMRFRFIYEVGRDYRALIEATFFQMRLFQGDETYIDGHALGKLPTGIDEGPWFDDAMNVRVWCEVLTWFPAALLNDPRVRWDALDESTAVLVVPFDEKEQRVIVRFDPDTGEMQYLEAMKYRSAETQMLWINAIWFDQGKQWIFMDVEQKLFNVEVDEAIRGTQPAASLP